MRISVKPYEEVEAKIADDDHVQLLKDCFMLIIPAEMPAVIKCLILRIEADRGAKS